ncbi:hypothetical protein C0J52_13184 [Blattella germanica]|nr:hypothetical protein C0J52_13184 [Blattella germanica]
MQYLRSIRSAILRENKIRRALTTAPHLATSNQQLAQANAVKKFKHVHEGSFFHPPNWRHLSITTLYGKNYGRILFRQCSITMQVSLI